MSASEARLQDLTRQHGPTVLAYLQRRCIPQDDAADVYQTVLMTVWRKIDRAPHEHELAWLIAIARNELANHRRGAHRRLAATDRLRLTLRLEPTEISDDPRVEVLRQAVAVLPARDREIVQLTYWEGLTSDEVATALGISPAAARKRLQRARERLESEITTSEAALAP